MVKYELIAQRLRKRLNVSGKLPPLLTVAREEGCSLNTVQRAVQELKKQGLIVTRTGLGTFLASTFNDRQHSERSAEAPAPAAGLPLRFIAFSGTFETFMNDLFGRTLFSGLEAIISRAGHPIQYQNLVIQRKLIPLRPESLAQPVCGTVCFAPFNNAFLADLAEHCKPMVCVDRDATPWGVDSIVFDNTAGALLATSRLLEMGHRAIAYLGSAQSEETEAGGDPALNERFEGFTLAHLARGASLQAQLCQKVKSLSADDVEPALAELIQMRRRFTALVAYDEHVAQVALQRLGEQGIRVPQDIALVSAGGISASSGISGVYFDISDIAERTWALLQKPEGKRLALSARFETGKTLARPAGGRR